MGDTSKSQAGASSPAPAGSADLLEWAWGIIANAGGGNWELESQEWREAASRWRDAYHGTLSSPNSGMSDPQSQYPPGNTPPQAKESQ